MAAGARPRPRARRLRPRNRLRSSCLGAAQIVHQRDHDRELRWRYPLAAQSSASTRVIDPRVRRPDSALNARARRGPCRCSSSCTGVPPRARNAPDSIRARNRSAHSSQVFSTRRGHGLPRPLGASPRDRVVALAAVANRATHQNCCWPFLVAAEIHPAQPRLTLPSSHQATPRVRARGVTSPPGRS